MRRVVWVVLALTGALQGCDKTADAPPPAPGADEIVSFTVLNRGQQLFQEHCAQCHGPEGQGHPDWRTPGVVAAPPLNGTGNDSQRSRAQLIGAIKNGVVRDGTPVMPAWKGRLSDADIEAVMTWFQTALWPPDVYSQWRRTSAAPPG
jgi:mono/diheme cytochrome c family protein